MPGILFNVFTVGLESKDLAWLISVYRDYHDHDELEIIKSKSYRSIMAVLAQFPIPSRIVYIGAHT